jgi:putative FmdB family regulatory protein
MPLYDFKCTVCEHIFEQRQKYKDPNPACEECNSATEKLITGTSFVLKGGGWYKDGYSKSNSKSDD